MGSLPALPGQGDAAMNNKEVKAHHDAVSTWYELQQDSEARDGATAASGWMLTFGESMWAHFYHRVER